MKIYLVSASLDDIQWAVGMGVVDGVITTPALLSAEGRPERELVADICRAAGTPVFVTAHAVNGDAVYRDAKHIAKISDQIIVQIPLVEDAIDAIRRLCQDGVRVAAMLVFNAAQGLLASRAGAACVITSVDHLDDVGYDGVEVVRELRSVFDAAHAECDVIAVGPLSATQVAHCVLAGADGVAVTPGVLRKLLVHPLTDRGLDQLLHDLSKQHGSWADV